MHSKKLKVITATALTVVITSVTLGDAVYAAENAYNQEKLVQAEKVLENVELTEDLIQDIKKIDESTEFVNGNYLINEKKAVELGLSFDKVQSVKKTYGEINNSINNGAVRVSEDGANVVTNNRVKRAADRIIFMKRISARQCNDIAALLAIGAGVAAVAAGIAALIPGINALVVPIITIVGGLLAIGSGVFWYAGNRNGITIRVYRSGRVRV